MLEINNNGQNIIQSTYWDTVAAHKGLFYLSFNAGAARLLVPDPRLSLVSEMSTGKYVIISQKGAGEGTELVFEDETDTPFSIHLDPRQVDRVLPQADHGREDLVFSAWGRGVTMLFERPAKFRRVKRLPWLKPWK